MGDTETTAESAQDTKKGQLFQGLQSDNRIRVFVRVRPPVSEGSPDGWQCLQNKYLTPIEGDVYDSGSSSSDLRPRSRGESLRALAFDHVFTKEATTPDVYDKSAKSVIMSALNGINGTIFMYGQTGSGKTHTMTGEKTNPGLIPLAMKTIFETIENMPQRKFLLRMAYIELYNEELRDLLCEKTPTLQVRENQNREFYIDSVQERVVNSPDQVSHWLKLGESHRHYGVSNMNQHSSRSHTIFRMVIESTESIDVEDDETEGTDAKAVETVRISTLNLVDLAGCETLSGPDQSAVRRQETIKINLSLTMLKNVIISLGKIEDARRQNVRPTVHVPYRNSNLTKVLKTSLGGNSRTVIICTLHPGLEEQRISKLTLQFGGIAQKIQTNAVVNETSSDDQRLLILQYKKQLADYNKKLENYDNLFDQKQDLQHKYEEILHQMEELRNRESERQNLEHEREAIDSMFVISSASGEKKTKTKEEVEEDLRRLDEIENQLEDAVNRNRNLKDELKKEAEMKEAAHKLVEEKQAELAVLNEEHSSMLSQLVEEQQQRENAEKDAEKQREALESLRKEHTGLADELEAEREKLERVEQEASDRKKEMLSLKHEKELLEAQMEQEKLRRSEFESRVQEMTEQSKMLEEQRSELETSLETERLQRETAEQAREEERNRRESAEQKLTHLQRELKQYTDKSSPAHERARRALQTLRDFSAVGAEEWERELAQRIFAYENRIYTLESENTEHITHITALTVDHEERIKWMAAEYEHRIRITSDWCTQHLETVQDEWERRLRSVQERYHQELRRLSARFQETEDRRKISVKGTKAMLKSDLESALHKAADIEANKETTLLHAQYEFDRQMTMAWKEPLEMQHTWEQRLLELEGAAHQKLSDLEYKLGQVIKEWKLRTDFRDD